MRILVATRNSHKLAEIRAIFDLPGVVLVAPDELGPLPGVEEDGDTFAANAIKKAVTLAEASGLWSLADDSGLEVDSLGGAPGVRSARYAGEPPDHAANNRKLLEALQTAADRRARFRCVLALSSPSGRARIVEGTCEGVITRAPRGREGFGYDPVFQPEGSTATFAEMTASEKHSLSHRGRALAAASRAWAGLVRQSPSDWPAQYDAGRT